MMIKTKKERSLSHERGAALVEMALVLPLLVFLLFGIIEASWAFAQQNDVRHGAREGARSAAVDTGDITAVGQAVCDRMDIVNPSEGITVTLTPITASGSTGGLATIRVDAGLQELTGFFGALFSGTVSSEIEFRTELPVEGDPAWWNGGAPSAYPCP
jgi:Flp pilus assembly protein TadG